MKKKLKVALEISIGINTVFPFLTFWFIPGFILGVITTIISKGNFWMLPLSLSASFLLSVLFYFLTGLEDQ